MFVTDVILAILYIMLVFLISIYILVGMLYFKAKVQLHKQQCKQEEDAVERFIEELYAWGKRNSNLVNQI